MNDRINELKMNELKDLFFYTLGIVPLQNYGVIGDGMTDNRLKIQQAIYDAIEVKAKYIFVPKGNYYYSQELFRADEVAWLGNSIDAYIKNVEIKQFPSFDNVVNITDAYSDNKQDTYSATYINNEVNKKVDKVEGKDLSTNDFTDEYKEKIDNKVDKVNGKGLSSNDFTDKYKQQLDNPINVSNEYSDSTLDTYSNDYINKKVDSKVDKVDGKELSSNDFTDEYKQKLDSSITVENEYSESTTSTYSANYINNKVDNINAYSTEEQVVGKWIDNKLLYRKSFNLGNFTNAGSYYIAHNIVNLDRVAQIYGTYLDGDKYMQIGSALATNSGDYSLAVAVMSTELLVWVGSGRAGAANVIVTIEYTKTTD